MRNKPILIVAGEPNSVFLEIFLKSINYKEYKSPIILIMSLNLLKQQMKFLKKKKLINLVEIKNLGTKALNNKKINLIDVEYTKFNLFRKVYNHTEIYIKNCFDLAFEILTKKITNKFINGPINKKKFLKRKYLGMTEYISNQFNIKNSAMLIFNKKLSVCPITTHLPLKLVSKNINKKVIKQKILLIDNFYKENIGFKPRIAITGINPHCESVDKFNEDEMIIKPSVNDLKKDGINIQGPISADTIFLKNNRIKYDVIAGIYHDQVLTPIKTLFEYDAINITLGLPFLRVSPDHGPNETMVGSNYSNPLSLIRAIEFLDNNG